MCVSVACFQRKSVTNFWFHTTESYKRMQVPHTRLTLHSEVDSLCRHPSFVYSNALVPARMIRGHRRHLKREVGQNLYPWVQSGIVASSQPGEVEVDSADDVAGEDSTGARRHSYITLDCDGWRRLCRNKTCCCWQLPGTLHHKES